MKDLLIGVSIWGDKYFDRFFNYCLPSLMADGNFASLQKERNIIFNFHTDNSGHERLLHFQMPYLWYSKIDVYDEEKYSQLARHQRCDLKTAGAIGADYHLLHPDFVYSENCFANIMRLANAGHRTVARLNMSTEQEAILPFIDRYRNADKITIPAQDLAALAVKNIHPACDWFVTPEGFPDIHVALFEGRDALHMISPHLTILYLDSEVIAALPDKQFTTLDAEIECFGKAYCTNSEDDICVIEITPLDERRISKKRISVDQFNKLSSRKMVCTDRLNRDILYGRHWLREDLIGGILNDLRNM